jgi:hypothetical protein
VRCHTEGKHPGKMIDDERICLDHVCASTLSSPSLIVKCGRPDDVVVFVHVFLRVSSPMVVIVTPCAARIPGVG